MPFFKHRLEQPAVASVTASPPVVSTAQSAKAPSPVAVNQAQPVQRLSIRTLRDRVAGNKDEKCVAGAKSDSRSSQVEQPVELGEDEFTEEDLWREWMHFAKGIKGDPRLKHLVESHVPEICPDYVLKINFENSIQVGDWEGVRLDLLGCLRKKLNNRNLTFQVHVMKGEELKAHAYTAREKFDEMAKKNKLLLQFKEFLGLEF